MVVMLRERREGGECYEYGDAQETMTNSHSLSPPGGCCRSKREANVRRPEERAREWTTARKPPPFR